ncbi:MAG: hypothetical protein AB8B99_10560 [Phormidesmis sp.]
MRKHSALTHRKPLTHASNRTLLSGVVGRLIALLEGVAGGGEKPPTQDL